MSTFETFCSDVLQIYDPSVADSSQCTGYIMLRQMVIDGVRPVSLEEMERWEKYPNVYELLYTPPREYLRFLHPILRPVVVRLWDYICCLPMSTPWKSTGKKDFVGNEILVGHLVEYIEGWVNWKGRAEWVSSLYKVVEQVSESGERVFMLGDSGKELDVDVVRVVQGMVQYDWVPQGTRYVVTKQEGITLLRGHYEVYATQQEAKNGSIILGFCGDEVITTLVDES